MLDRQERDASPTPPASPIPILAIAADADFKHVRELERHAAVAVRDGWIRFTGRAFPKIGKDREQAFTADLRAAPLSVVLVTNELFANDKSAADLARLKERVDAAEVSVVPVLVEPVELAGSWLGPLAAIPLDGRPISKVSDHDTPWADVARYLGEKAREIAAPAPPEPAPPPSRKPESVRGGDCGFGRFRDPGVFVGRAAELARFEAALDGAAAGSRRTLVVQGDPGAGKTRLACHIVLRARARGARVLSVRCGAFRDAYSTVLALLEECAAEPSAIALRRALGEPHAMREFDLFQLGVELVRALSRDQVLVTVLDDVQAADERSLALLRNAVQALPDAPWVIVATNNDVEARVHGGEVQAPLLDLEHDCREGDFQCVRLEGWTDAEIAEYVAGSKAVKLTPEAAAALRSQTGGNPFFVTNLVNLLAAEGRLTSDADPATLRAALPESAREVIERMLSYVSSDCADMLAVASAVGQVLELDLLAAVLDRKPPEILRWIDEAVRARVLRASGPEFQHGLVRDALYAGLFEGRRAWIHGRVADALAARGPASDERAAELAHHLYLAPQATHGARFIEQALRAAERATSLRAYGEAAKHYGRCAERLAEDDPRRGDVLLHLGEACTNAGDTERAAAAFREALGIHRAAADAARFARAALGLSASGSFGVVTTPGSADAEIVGVLEEAHAMLGAAPTALRAFVEGRLSIANYFCLPEIREHWGRAALETARACGDPGAEIAALESRCYVLAGSADLDERTRIARELSASAADDPLASLHASQWEMLAVLESADPAEIDAAFERLVTRAGALKRPMDLWYARFGAAARAAWEGKFDEAGRLLAETRAIVARAPTPLAFAMLDSISAHLRWMRGNLSEARAEVEAAVKRYPAYTTWQAFLAQILCEMGDADGARAILDRLSAEDFGLYRRDALWVTHLAILSEVACHLGDRRHAAALYDLLAPYADRNVVVGRAVFIRGSTSHYLGLLATLLGRWTDAARHFVAARKIEEAMRSTPFVARTLEAHADLLLASANPDDEPAARGLLADAVAIYGRLGMRRFAARATGTLARLRPPPSAQPLQPHA